MRRLALFMFTLFPPFCSAQTEFGIKGGLNVADIVITNYINPDVEADFRLKAGLHAGLFVHGKLKERFWGAAELLYNEKGVNANGKIRLHYFTLPLMILYQLNDHVFFEAGPELGYLFAATSDFGNVSGTYNNKFDLGLDAGFRYHTPKVSFGIRYCVGVFSVRDAEPYNVPGVEKIKYQNRVLQFSVGYKLFTLE